MTSWMESHQDTSSEATQQDKRVMMVELLELGPPSHLEIGNESDIDL